MRRHIPSDEPAYGRQVQRRRWSYVAIGVMTLAFIIIVLFRDDIIARWTLHQLARTEQRAQRMYLVVRLVELGDAGARAAAKLARSKAVADRRDAVEVASRVRCEQSDRLLLLLAYDKNADVRRDVMRALVIRGDEFSTQLLSDLLRRDDDATARQAAHQLALLGGQTAASQLLERLIASPSLSPGLKIEIMLALGDLDYLPAFEPLIDAIGDRRVFEGVTERDAEGARLLSKSGTSTMPDGGPLVPSMLAVDRKHVVGDVAERVLERLAGVPLAGMQLEGEDVSERQKRLHAWWAAHAEEVHARQEAKPKLDPDLQKRLDELGIGP